MLKKKINKFVFIKMKLFCFLFKMERECNDKSSAQIGEGIS